MRIRVLVQASNQDILTPNSDAMSYIYDSTTARHTWSPVEAVISLQRFSMQN